MNHNAFRSYVCIPYDFLELPQMAHVIKHFCSLSCNHKTLFDSESAIISIKVRVRVSESSLLSLETMGLRKIQNSWLNVVIDANMMSIKGQTF